MIYAIVVGGYVALWIGTGRVSLALCRRRGVANQGLAKYESRKKEYRSSDAENDEAWCFLYGALFPLTWAWGLLIVAFMLMDKAICGKPWRSAAEKTQRELLRQEALANDIAAREKALGYHR